MLAISKIKHSTLTSLFSSCLFFKFLLWVLKDNEGLQFEMPFFNFFFPPPKNGLRFFFFVNILRLWNSLTAPLQRTSNTVIFTKSLFTLYYTRMCVKDVDLWSIYRKVMSIFKTPQKIKVKFLKLLLQFQN